jgi:hypothetical protein
MVVFVYRNLNRKGVVYSVRNEATKLVCDRTGHVLIENATFKVSESGRQRVIREQRKNVHAGVRGTRIDTLPEEAKKMSRVACKYNPYEAPHFTTKFGVGLTSAKYVEINEQGCFAYY